MFAIVRTIIRHKLPVAVLLGAGAFFLLPEGEEEDAASKNPWAVQPAGQVAAAEDPGMVGEMVSDAGDYLDEQGISPASLADQNDGGLGKAAQAYDGAAK